MRSLEPHNRLRIGLMGLLVTALVIGVGQSITSVPILFAKPIYYAQFTDTRFAGVGQSALLQGADDFCLGTAQEGVGGFFQCDGRG